MHHVKKNEIPAIRKETISAVCIDDFALKKGHSYGTVMVDIMSRRIIDMIATRDPEPVQAWLETYPALQFVSRDGSITYKSAVSRANESITQISDRFHLLKGLTDAAKKFIGGYFKANIALPVSASHYDGIETADYWDKDTGNADFPTRQHACAAERKARLVEEARRLQEEGYAPRKIAELIGASGATVKKYLDPGFKAENAGYNTAFASKIKPYAFDIKDMLSKGRAFTEIEREIRLKGYDGAASTIRMFATRERKLLKEAGGAVEKIERKWLTSLLYRPIDKVKELSKKQLDAVIGEHPVIGKLFDIVKSFKETLFSKKEAELDKWIEYAAQLGISEVDTFINGVARDIEAVKNAIKLDISNGLAEGSVNKLKVIKRIMYGRCSFAFLKSKVLLLESKKQIN